MSTDGRDLRFVVIGAGMAGLLAAIELRKAGHDDVTVYEKNSGVGGTWFENTYPGLSCDVPSHFYSYSFALNPEWSRRYSSGPEIRSYFEDIARRYEIYPRIRFDSEITECRFEDGRWHLRTKEGTRDVADFVIAATGVLHHPAIPAFEGMADFAGAAFHSARWDHDVPTRDRRVGVVGTGSSAIQIVSALADDVDELVLFQRTAQWIMPTENPPYSEAEHEEFRRNPGAMQTIREETARRFTDGFANILVDAESPILEMTQEMCRQHLEQSVRDPVLREKLRPTYRAACKRLVLSDRFYEAIQRPNARLVTEEIERLEEKGVRTRDGALHELDVLVLATGFRVDRFVRPMEVLGVGGRHLDDAWKDGPTAYLALTVPDFPNFFLLNGPNGPVGNFSLIEVAELQLGYLLQLVEEVRTRRCRTLCVSHRAMERFDRERREAARNTIWASGCRSWYLDASGLPTAWPFTFDRFREEMARPKLVDYATTF